ncbi:hypothetical protein A1QO_03940 [Vibrio genomosp. F10 str. ZF-129]|uniref:Uncharacterized protein n=1 Tax=Vibrio genomosp. F10 str. ZF-129 TaxID=1187848 RepID=A0A1E5BIX5_9VIBR|nr:hypothetical protein [Vibrio genomosp. F10]OEE37262.1 hypothetical protein A1QO_03940 [Vibrio genomosp. F10 str. ZF-129]
MNKTFLAAMLILTIPTHSAFAGDDSTSTVVSSVTQDANFQDSSGNKKRIYQGSTYGKIGFSNAYKYYAVNGLMFVRGLGATSNLKMAEGYNVTYTGTCENDRAAGERRCNNMRSVTASAPDCIISMNDSGAIGCNTKKIITHYTCVNEYCRGEQETLGLSVPITSVVGFN